MAPWKMFGLLHATMYFRLASSEDGCAETLHITIYSIFVLHRQKMDVYKLYILLYIIDLHHQKTDVQKLYTLPYILVLHCRKTEVEKL